MQRVEDPGPATSQTWLEPSVAELWTRRLGSGLSSAADLLCDSGPDPCFF